MKNTNTHNLHVESDTLSPEAEAVIDKVIEMYEPQTNNPECWIDFEAAMADIRRDILSA